MNDLYYKTKLSLLPPKKQNTETAGVTLYINHGRALLSALAEVNHGLYNTNDSETYLVTKQHGPGTEFLFAEIMKPAK